MEPKCRFETVAEARAYLTEWQSRLGLHDWVIKVKLCEPHEFQIEDCDGECVYQLVNKAAVISILKSEYYGDRILKYCAERILVHELLHCKLCLLDTEETTLGCVTHQLQEDIAKALICAKYQIPLDWFSDIRERGGEHI